MIGIKKYEHILIPLFKKYGLTNVLSISHFLSQIDHESNGLKRLVENLNYSSDGLAATFSRSRISLDDCMKFGRRPGRAANQVMIANIVYGGRFGALNLGNKTFGDGWKYIGRGPLQCTGFHNYKAFGTAVGKDFVNHPEMMVDLENGFEFACWFWKKNGLNELFDVVSITKKVNGGTNGLKHRQKLFTMYSKSKAVTEIFKLITNDI